MINYEWMDDFLNNDSNLPVSEETLAAYAEGKLDGLATSYIENIISKDPNVAELVNEIQNEDDLSFDSFINHPISDTTVAEMDLNGLQLPELQIDETNYHCEDLMVAACDDLHESYFDNGNVHSGLIEGISDSIENIFDDGDSLLTHDESIDIEEPSDYDDMFNNSDDL